MRRTSFLATSAKMFKRVAQELLYVGRQLPKPLVATAALAMAMPSTRLQELPVPLPAQHTKKLATLINGIVDLPHMEEEEEQEIFEHAVDRILIAMEDFLPKSYWARILTDKPLPEEQRDVLRMRMVSYLQATLHLPYLSDEDQHLIIHGVVAIVSDAMGETKLGDILEHEIPPIPLVSVYIRGAMGIENVDAIREQCQNILQLPLPISIPRPIEDYIVNHVVDALVSVLGDAIDITLKECFGVKSHAKITTSTEDFLQVLKANTTTLFREHLDLRLTPEIVEEYFIMQLVDAYFSVCVDEKKVSDAIAVLMDPLEPPIHIQPLEPPIILAEHKKQ